MAKNTGFNDSVHGYMAFEPLLVRIIHTPQFQRMKDIKQLGAAYWVYPGASHNRFEHSLGTAHLAGKMIERLRDIHREETEITYKIDITDEEVLCVKIAALCHDLGHGPFSHVFDKQMKTKLIKYHQDRSVMENGEFHRQRAEKLHNWEHEDASCEMFDHMLEKNPQLDAAFKQNNIRKHERNLIKYLIKGELPKQDVDVAAVPTVNQHRKRFLFEIVANKSNEIDCDKFDYFARDCLNLGVKCNFDHMRYIHNIRILLVGGEYRLCVRDKLEFNIYELFHTRWSLHHRVYQHKTTKAIEDMITDAFILLEDKYNFSNAIFNMKEYSKLTDGIFYEIIHDRKDQDEANQGQDQAGQGQDQANQGQDQVNQGHDQGQDQANQGQDQINQGHDQANQGQNQVNQGHDQGQDQANQGQDQVNQGHDQANQGQDQANQSRDQANQGKDQADQGQVQSDQGQGQVDQVQGQANDGHDQPFEHATPMEKAQDILRRIQQRKLYKLCCQIQPPEKLKSTAFEVVEGILSLDGRLSSEYLFVSIVNIDFGMKDDDLVKSVVFYEKTGKIREDRSISVSTMLPQKFSEQYVRVYTKKPENRDKGKIIVDCFKQWYDNNYDKWQNWQIYSMG